MSQQKLFIFFASFLLQVYSSVQNGENSQVNLDFIGMGYNSLLGNPLFSNKLDPGLNYAMNVFEFSYAQNKTSPDRYFRIPDQVNLSEIRQCGDTDAEQYQFTGMSGYYSSTLKQLGFSLGLTQTAFSLSEDYQGSSKMLSGGKNVQFSQKQSCTVYELIPNPELNSTKLQSGFQNLVRVSYKLNDWTALIQNYGTHYVHQTKCGGRISAQFMMQGDDYSYLEGGDYDFQSGLNSTFSVNFGLSNASGEAQKQAKYFKSYLASSSYFMIGGAIPQNSSNPILDWRKSVQTNLSALDYQIYPLSDLFHYAEFKDLNQSDLASSFLKGISAYCQKYGCKTPSPDSPFPYPARSLIRQEGRAGVSNYDLDESQVISFKSKFSDQMSPLLQICSISFCCEASFGQLQGFRFQLCDTLNEPQEVQSMGNWSNYQANVLVNWTRPLSMEASDFLSTVEFYYGYAEPVITNLRFRSKMGVQTTACSVSSENSQFSKSYTFDDPIVGFAGKYVQDGPVRYLEFYQNHIQYNYTLTHRQLPAPRPQSPRLIPNRDYALRIVIFNMYCDLVQTSEFLYKGNYPTYNNEGHSNEMLYFYVTDDQSSGGTSAKVAYNIYNPDLVDTALVDLRTSSTGINSVSISQTLQCWYKYSYYEWTQSTFVYNASPVQINCYQIC